MATPTVPVTVDLDTIAGEALAGITVKARLDANEVYEGIIVSKQVEAVTDADGVAVLDLFPNALSPNGLGTQGTTYRFTAAISGGRSVNVRAVVPNTACRLENILVDSDPVTLSAAELALAQAQTAVTTAATSAAAAAASATAAAASEASVDADATAASDAATAAAASEASAESSATAAASSATSAATSETNAATSATSAASSASAAASSAAEAATVVLGDFLQTGTGAVARSFTAKVGDVVSILDFIPVAEHAAIKAGTSTYDCYADIMEAVNSQTFGTPWYVSGPAIYFPNGTYKCNSTIQLKKSVKLYGDGSGLPSQATAKIVFPAGVSGIIVHRYNTTGATTEGTPTTAADGSIIEGLWLQGAYGTADAAGGHGIWLRARAIVRNCRTTGFTGHGRVVDATAGGTAAHEGNANCFEMIGGRSDSNGEWGFYAVGADANAGFVLGLDCSGNGSGGIWDSSFLGNTYIACHTSDNGEALAGYNTTRGRTSTVWYSGYRYYATYGATEAQLVATTPGTDSAIWTQGSADASGGGSFPTWLAAQPVGTYFVSNQYRTDNANARNLFLNCYEEGGYSNSVVTRPTMVLGGLMSSTGGVFVTSDLTETKFSGVNYMPTLRADVIRLPDSVGTHDFEWKRVTGRWGVDWANGGSPQRIYFYDRNATVANGYGRTIDANAPLGNNGSLGIGTHYFGSHTEMFYRGLGFAAPTSGTYKKGDIIWNTDPAFTAFIGWVCTASGTPGTWKTFGAITP